MHDKKYEDEINFRALLKNPLRLFGWIYPIFFVLLLGLGIFYVKNLDFISINTQLGVNFDSLNIEIDIPLKKGGLMPAVDMSTISNPTDESTKKGEELYKSNCSSCHGDNGAGDGTAGVALNPPPRNFSDVDGWTNGRDFSAMYKTLQEGIINNGMAAYEYLPVEDRFAIIHYIRTFTEFPQFTEDEITMLDQSYNLSADVVIPNQISVKSAIKKISEENYPKVKEVENLNDYVMNHQYEMGAQLLVENSVNLKRVLSAFVNSLEFESVDTYIQKVTASPIELGYKTKVVSLSGEDWQILYNYLSNVSKLNLG